MTEFSCDICGVGNDPARIPLWRSNTEKVCDPCWTRLEAAIAARAGTTLYVLSCRNEHGDEVERMGPFRHVIVRTGSNWIELEDPDAGWQTKSVAHFSRILIETVTGNEPPPEEPDWGAPW